MGIGFLLNSTLVGMSCMMVGFLCVCVVLMKWRVSSIYVDGDSSTVYLELYLH
jgi:hypothetical protein